MQRDKPLKIVGELRAMFGLAARESVSRQVMRMAKMVNASE